jgi:hypothetical protein
MAVIHAVEVEGPQRAVALASKPSDASNVRPPPLPSTRGARPEPPASMRVPKGTGQALADEHSEIKPAKPRQDADSGREWALRAAETKARIAAAEEREWLAQLAEVKAAAATQEEEAEWRALRERAALAEQREWEVAIARARAAAVNTPPATPRAKPPTRPARPGRSPTVSQFAPRMPGVQAAPSTPSAPVVSTAAIVFTPFGHVALATSAPALPRGQVVAWP